MYTGEVLKRVGGLTHEKLTSSVRAGHIKTLRIKSQGFCCNDFSAEDVELIKRAWKPIPKHDVEIKVAFSKATEET